MEKPWKWRRFLLSIPIALEGAIGTQKYRSKVRKQPFPGCSFAISNIQPGPTRMNFHTKQAEEKNAENLLVIRDKALAEKYVQNWQAHAKRWENYERKAR